MHRVTLLAVLLLSSPGFAADLRIVVLGDSNATGYRVPAPVAWPMRVMARLRWPVQVLGAPGASLAGAAGLATTAECPAVDVGYLGVRAAVLALGTNDAWQNAPLPAVAAATATLLGSVTPDRWVCLLPPPSIIDGIPNAVGATLADYRAVIGAACVAHGATVIDPATLGVRQADLVDGIHLSSGAHARIARAVEAAVQ